MTDIPVIQDLQKAAHIPHSYVCYLDTLVLVKVLGVCRTPVQGVLPEEINVNGIDCVFHLDRSFSDRHELSTPIRTSKNTISPS